MAKNWLLTLSILFFLPLTAFASNFQHVSTWGYDLWDLSLNLEQAKWLAKRQDWIFGGTGNKGLVGEVPYDTMESANPNMKFIPYISHNTYEPDVQNWIKNWCKRNGYNFEDTFYHYYYETEVKLRGAPHVVLIKGYGGGTAKTIQESRVPSSWASYTVGVKQSTGEITRFNINPTSKAVWKSQK